MAEKTRFETTEQLRRAIDSGATGEKADWPDPAAAPLGTDDEAAGHPPDAAAVRTEDTGGRVPTRRGTSLGAALIYVAVAVALLGAMALIVVQG